VDLFSGDSKNFSASDYEGDQLASVRLLSSTILCSTSNLEPRVNNLILFREPGWNANRAAELTVHDLGSRHPIILALVFCVGRFISDGSLPFS